MVGVRAWLARGYFIPGGASQRGGVSQAPAFRVARCRTRSLVDIRLGPIGSRQGSSGTRMGLYLSRTQIRHSRVIRRTLTGPIVPHRGSDANPTEPLLQPIWPDEP